MSIAENLKTLRDELPKEVTLIAVSKTKPIELLKEAYQAGQRQFGENKAQEMALKAPQLPNDVEWHFIGHLQTNKVKMIAPVVHTIHSIDSLKLLTEINREAAKAGRTIRCLLQFHIATEETKFGLDEIEAHDLMRQTLASGFKNVIVAGVMGMATYTDNHETIRTEFEHLHKIFKTLKSTYFAADDRFKEISMGMSGDYKMALEQGSTCIRIGTAIFGERNYQSFK